MARFVRSVRGGVSRDPEGDNSEDVGFSDLFLVVLQIDPGESGLGLFGGVYRGYLEG